MVELKVAVAAKSDKVSMEAITMVFTMTVMIIMAMTAVIAMEVVVAVAVAAVVSFGG